MAIARLEAGREGTRGRVKDVQEELLDLRRGIVKRLARTIEVLSLALGGKDMVTLFSERGAPLGLGFAAATEERLE